MRNSPTWDTVFRVVSQSHLDDHHYQHHHHQHHRQPHLSFFYIITASLHLSRAKFVTIHSKLYTGNRITYFSPRTRPGGATAVYSSPLLPVQPVRASFCRTTEPAAHARAHPHIHHVTARPLLPPLTSIPEGRRVRKGTTFRFS